MKSAARSLTSLACLLLGFAAVTVQARDNLLSVVPSDSLGFVAVHNLADTSRSIGEVAKIVHAPAPDLLSFAKGFAGIQKGIDEQGDLALVLLAMEPTPKHVVLVPVANFDEFFAELKVEAPKSGTADCQLFGKPAVVGRKGTFAAFALAGDRDDLEKYLAAPSNKSVDESLSAWYDANRVSFVLTAEGVKQLVPKLISGIQMAQSQVARLGGQNTESASKALNMYIDLFTAAQREVVQFGLGVRIDAAHTIDIAKRIQFQPDGKWAGALADAKPANEDLLAGLQGGPFVFAGGGVVPQEALHKLMNVSIEMMQANPAFKLTPEDAKKYIELSMEPMKSVHIIRMLMANGEPGTGLYGNTSALMTVDDSKRYLDDYEKSLAEIRKLAEQSKESSIPVGTTKHISAGGVDALEVTMDLNKMKLPNQDAEKQKKMMQLFVGEADKLKIYVAPADEHTVVMAYTSVEHLKSAIDNVKDKKSGLSADEGVAKVASTLPTGSQLVGFASPRGIAKIVQQSAATLHGANVPSIPELPECPPIGMSARFSKTGVEGHLVITAKTLQSIADTVAQARHRPKNPPAEQ